MALAQWAASKAVEVALQPAALPLDPAVKSLQVAAQLVPEEMDEAEWLRLVQLESEQASPA